MLADSKGKSKLLLIDTCVGIFKSLDSEGSDASKSGKKSLGS